MVVKLDLTQVRRSNGGQVITNGKLGKQAKKVVKPKRSFAKFKNLYLIKKDITSGYLKSPNKKQ